MICFINYHGVNVLHVYREITHTKLFPLTLVQHDKELNHRVLSERVDQHSRINDPFTTTSITTASKSYHLGGKLNRDEVHSQGSLNPCRK